MKKEDITSCIHFAGLKAVGESVEKPWEYYHNNLTGTLILVDVLKKYGAKNLIFSSSATVYGDPAQIPITEECPKRSVHESIWLDKIHVRAGSDGHSKRQIRIEYCTASLL